MGDGIERVTIGHLTAECGEKRWYIIPISPPKSERELAGMEVNNEEAHEMGS